MESGYDQYSFFPYIICSEFFTMFILLPNMQKISEMSVMIVSGLIGVNGPHVLRLVEKMDYSKERGQKVAGGAYSYTFKSIIIESIKIRTVKVKKFQKCRDDPNIYSDFRENLKMTFLKV